MLVEVDITSYMFWEVKIEEAERIQTRYDQLTFIEEKKLKVLCYGQFYQRRITRAYDKKGQTKGFQIRWYGVEKDFTT